MTDKKSNDSRRKLLKSIAAGSGAIVAGKTLPESWSKPVIDTVLLPAHAATTGEEPCCVTAVKYCGVIDTNMAGEEVQKPTKLKYRIRIEVEADYSVSVKVFPPYPETYSGSTTVACTGGRFEATLMKEGYEAAPTSVSSDNNLDSPERLTVIGTLICGNTAISGTVTGITGTYTATTAGCSEMSV